MKRLKKVLFSVFVWNAIFILSCSTVDNLGLESPPSQQDESDFERNNFDDFEGGNKWVIKYSGKNRWVVGTDVSHGGSRSAYITNNGSSYAYSNDSDSGSTSNLYRTVKFPYSATDFTLSFSWKGIAEGYYDCMTVYLVPSNKEAVKSYEAPSDDYRIGKTYYSGQPNWTHEIINLSALTYSEQTYKLVFHWKNDSFSGDGNPVAIDNVQITR